MLKKLSQYILCVLLFALISLRGTVAYGQNDLPAGVYGTEFWLAFLSNNGVLPENKPKLTVYAVAEKKVDIIVALGGSGNKLGEIHIGAGGGFGTLTNITPASVYPAANESEQITNRGVIIYAKDGKTPFSCYAYSEAGEAAKSTRDATLLLPKDIL